MKLKLLVPLVLIVVLTAAGAAAVFVGFEINDRRLPTYGLWRALDEKLVALVRPMLPTAPLVAEHNTALVLLVSETQKVKLDPAQLLDDHEMAAFTGGGMTSFGNDLLLLPYDGHLYATRPDGAPRRLPILAPDNGRFELQALARDPSQTEYLLDQLHFLRYNDVKFFDTPAGRGLISSYTEFHSGQNCTTNNLARLDFGPGVAQIDDVTADAADWHIFYRSRPCLPLKKRWSAIEGHMAGGRIVILEPSTVILANGDFHHDGMRSNGKGISQDPANDYGKVMSIDFLTGEAQMLTLGHRNPQGITMDARGRIFVAEQGPKGGDELNLIDPGGNYGWPLESYGTTYADQKLPESKSYGRHEEFAAPVFAWIPSPSISAIVHVAPGFHPAWDGDLVATSMIDRALHRVRFADGRPVYSESIPLHKRIRHIHQHTNGQLVLWTDSHEIIWLRALDRDSYRVPMANFVRERGIDAQLARSLEASIMRCAECHSFQAGDDARSPSIARIYGEPIASTTYAGYSDALLQAEGNWSSENLAAFLAEPQQFAPGTTMRDLFEDDPELVKLVVDYLEYFSNLY